jgi:hypothetical protein
MTSWCTRNNIREMIALLESEINAAAAPPPPPAASSVSLPPGVSAVPARSAAVGEAVWGGLDENKVPAHIIMSPSETRLMLETVSRFREKHSSSSIEQQLIE